MTRVVNDYDYTYDRLGTLFKMLYTVYLYTCAHVTDAMLVRRLHVEDRRHTRNLCEDTVRIEYQSMV